MEGNETHIIVGLRERNPRMQEKALELYGNAVWAQVTRLVTGVEDAEEVYQDVFVKVFRNIDRYDEGRSSLATWISRIAYNECITFLRRRRPAMVYFEDDEGKAETLSEAEVERTFGHPDAETVQLVRAAIRHLPPDERAIITLYYYDEKNLKEIAYVTDSLPATVASRLSRTRKKLCKIIKMLRS